jgi:hypothetical protein
VGELPFVFPQKPSTITDVPSRTICLLFRDVRSARKPRHVSLMRSDRNVELVTSEKFTSLAVPGVARIDCSCQQRASLEDFVKFTAAVNMEVDDMVELAGGRS